MKYMGSKNRHAKELLPIILKDKGDRWYVEPFVGGCNMIDKVKETGLFENYIGADIDEDLICLWQAVAAGWMPPESITEEEYHELKKQVEPSPLKGYAAFALSYGGKKWGGWRRDKVGKRNYCREAYNNASKQFPSLLGVDFRRCSYLELDIPDNSVVYCDPPYFDSTAYKSSSSFNHNEFWQWVRDLSRRCKVYVSEYTAPEDFTCVWSKEVTSSLTQDTGSKRNVEKLFVHYL